MNKKNLLFTVSIIIIMTLLSNSSYGQNRGPSELNKNNTLSSINILLDGRAINPQLIKQDGVIYARATDLLSTFSYRYSYDEKLQTITIGEIKLPAWRAGYIKENNNKEIFLPLLETLSLMQLRYLFSDLYGNEMISIRTDGYNYSNSNKNTDTTTSTKKNNPTVIISSSDSKENNNINININIDNNPNYEQDINQIQGNSSSNNSSLPDIPGYNGELISSVPDLMAYSNYNNIVRGYGRRTLLGFYSVYGVEPQPFGTGFPYMLGSPYIYCPVMPVVNY